MRAPKTFRNAVPAINFTPLAAAVATLALWAPAAHAAPPAPCGGTPQIADPRGDGHHNNTDVVAAWVTETGGRLQAVIRVYTGIWEPAHEDSESAGFAFLYRVGGQTRYVRTVVRFGAQPVFDHGTWTLAGGFVSEGATTGEVTTGFNGTTTMDIPALPAGTVLANPFVLTYDGIEGGQPHWVDRGPGGTTPAGSEYGADYVVGSCFGAPAGPGGDPGTDPGAGAPTTSAISLQAPRRMTGSGKATIRGHVTPARGGVSVTVTAKARRTLTRTVTTAADGSFKVALPVSETTSVRAVADGLGSQTYTIKMYSRVRIKVRTLKSGAVVVTGTTSPKLTGRVLLLRSNAVRPSARTTARNGRFKFRLRHPRPGRYQAVYIPRGGRAERSTSNTGVIR
jgi:hypothetical protein